MVPVEFVGAIIACSLLVVLISYVDFDVTDRRLSPQPIAADNVPSETTPGATELPDCGRMEAEFSEKLEQSRSCTVDADCALATYGCPFGCTTSVNRSALGDLQRAEDAFQATCHHCTYLCQVPLLEWRAACVRQRCIVMEQSVEDLEEETMELLNEPG